MSAPAEESVAAVHPLAGFDKLLHYRVPAALRSEIFTGSLVRIPLQRRQALGVVAEIDGPVDFPADRLKRVIQAVYPFPALSPDLLGLARWVGSYYAANLESVFEAMLPGAVRRGAAWKREYLLSLNPAQTASAEELAKLSRRAPQQFSLYEFLRQQFKPVVKGLVLKRLGVSASSCAALVARGWIVEEVRRVERVAYEDAWSRAELVESAAPQLNAEQQCAVDSISASLAGQAFAVHLLHGVTGSGKTEVYLRALESVLSAGGGAIFLVPEVALTPQTVSRLRARLERGLGHKTVVWHSHLSEGERLDGWFSLATAEARLVVGARSAVFAPIRDLRLIVVDEEHEPAYKQDETPRYHGRDVAVYRAMLNRAVCVLGSATPSLESVANVRQGKYRCDRLMRRVDDRRLPDIQVIDMRREILRRRAPSALSEPLAEALRARFQAKEQSILFINRRGYSSSMLCQACGFVAECDHCSIALTYHRSDESLKCHLCGTQRKAYLVCPQCRSPTIRWRGLGTQRVEEAVRRLLPQARIERIDTDTMGKKDRFREILGDFRTGRIDLLVGTQMIAKGLDFPNVTLVGLVDADISLHVPDFRASERTFQLLVQVAGRAGRGDRAGQVLVQTFTPHGEAIQFARKEDFDGFIEAEMQIREAFGYPPFRHLVHHLFRGPNPEKLRFFAEHWAKRVEEAFAGRLELRGPAPAPIEKIKDQYRFQLWYLMPRVSKLIPELVQLQRAFAWPEDVVQVIDVDAVSLS